MSALAHGHMAGVFSPVEKPTERERRHNREKRRQKTRRQEQTLPGGESVGVLELLIRPRESGFVL